LSGVNRLTEALNLAGVAEQHRGMAGEQFAVVAELYCSLRPDPAFGRLRAVSGVLARGVPWSGGDLRSGEAA
jgi:hypothetical protein